MQKKKLLKKRDIITIVTITQSDVHSSLQTEFIKGSMRPLF